MAKRSPWQKYVGKDVRIAWTDPYSDWEYYRVVSCLGQAAEIQGINDPDGTPHDGDCFDAWWREVKSIDFAEIPKAPTDDSYSELIENRGVLERAREIVDGRDKQQHYGPPEESMSRIAQVWSGILGITVTPGKVALMMAGLKLARLGADPEHADSLDDLAGYARVYERVKGLQ